MSKGDRTKTRIKNTARELFVVKGFSAVTMKDICEATNISRGGLYRHYSSTGEIFRDIFSTAADSQSDLIFESITSKKSAVWILDELFSIFREEMRHPEQSLSFAIYEYSELCDKQFMQEMHQKSQSRWRKLINYGIVNGEFNKVNIDQFINMLLYSYQGVRMCSRILLDIDDVPNSILSWLRDVLVRT